MKNTSLIEVISKVCQRNPQKIAIEKGEQQLTYDDMLEEFSKIAALLQQRVKENKIVYLLLEKSPELITALLGVVKAGCIFVPIDLNYPDDRIKLMMKEAPADLAIVDRKGLDKLERLQKTAQLNITPIIAADSAILIREDGVERNLTIQNVSINSAPVLNKYCYIYFTSGSTGRPKGVLGRQKSLQHFIEWEVNELALNLDYRYGQLTSPSFDPYLRDILTPLWSGGTICIPEKQELLLDFEKLVEWIVEKEITFIHITPSLFRHLLKGVQSKEQLAKLRYIVFAGEMVRGTDLHRFYHTTHGNTQLVNLYGPTETTLAKLFYRIKREDQNRVNVVVGKPIPGAEVLVLDEEMQRCRIGNIGEVYIRTPYISSGYYNQPELTRQVFMQNPFSDNPRDIIYKTGDLGRILPDGNLELVGRIDHLVKIRGVRVELTEIENQLLSHPEIKEAVVIDRDDLSSGTYLTAFLVTDRELTIGELHQTLRKVLPEVMIPTYFIRLTQMPLTPNGKIDRQALPDPQSAIDYQIKGQYTPPVGETQIKLVQIFAEVLHVDKVGITDNFFELGGHSLKVARLVSYILRDFGVKIPLQEIFNLATVENIQRYIQSAEKNLYSAIEKAEDREVYPLSAAQKRLYILHQLDGQNINYNLARAFLVKGKLDLKRVVTAFDRLIARHEALRTSFEVNSAGDIVQRIHRTVSFELEQVMVEPAVIQQVAQEFIRPFELNDPPLLRVKLVQFTPEEYLILMDIHHIISDGTSMGILTKEFLELYEGKELNNPSIRYRDYAVWQQGFFKSPEFVRQENYWLQRFSDQPPVLNLLTDFPRPIVQSYQGEKIFSALVAELTVKLEQLAKKSGTTLFMILLAGYNILLAKYTGQKEFIVGSPVAGRSDPALQEVIGVFINTLAFRNRVESGNSFLAFLTEVKSTALEGYENQDYPFELLIEKLKLRRDLGRNPLFDTLLGLHNEDIESVSYQTDSLTLSPYLFSDQIARFDLSINWIKIDDTLEFQVEYCTDIFLPQTMERLAVHYRRILEIIADNPDIIIAEIDLLSDIERRRLLVDFNGIETEHSFCAQKTLVEMFFQQVEKSPRQIALCCREDELSYEMLALKVNKLARILREKGVRPETIVGVLVKRSLEMMIAILAIVRAGGVYLPLDPDYPEARINYMLKDSKARLLLTIPGLIKENVGVEILNLLDESLFSNSVLVNEPGEISKPEDLAYLIYTSGSTGEPKGVMIEHRSVVNLIYGLSEVIDFSVGKTLLSLTTISFDIFGVESFVALTRGLKVVIATEAEQRLPEFFDQVMCKHRVQMIQSTPSKLQILTCDNNHLQGVKNLQEIIIGGEELPERLLKRLQGLTKAKIYNVYGPTEATIWSTCKEIKPIKENNLLITIGSPLANTRIYILDQNLKLVPEGIEGEVYIAGAGVARGYYQQEQLTAERFPTISLQNGRIERAYRTGDLGCWLNNGEIRFLGRSDQQLKIRGQRIEPGEIEERLRQIHQIKEAVVIGHKDIDDSLELIAYLVVDGEISQEWLRKKLAQDLPAYMIPTKFSVIPELPFTPNGKIDRNRLTEMAVAVGRKGKRIHPTNSVEMKLSEIWMATLKISEVGIEDNFFEIGGHSLKAIQVVDKIKKVFAKNVGLQDLFIYPTIAELAEFLQETGEIVDYDAIARQPWAEDYELSYTQKRFWLLWQMNSESSAYNLTGQYSFAGDLNLEYFNTACDFLVQRHEILRTIFITRSGEPRQKIITDWQLRPEFINWDESAVQKESLDSLITAETSKPFDLSKEPAIRILIFQLSEKKYHLVFTFHHIIADGWSIDIFYQELTALYQRFASRIEVTLPSLPIQYKDFAVWQNQQLASGVLNKSKDFWHHSLTGELNLIKLPYDYPYINRLNSSHGASYSFYLSREKVTGLKELAQSCQASLFIVLLAGFNLFLARLSGETEIIIAGPVVGREHRQVKGLLGCFLNTVIYRNQVDLKQNLQEFVMSIRESTLGVLAHQDYPLELLIEELDLENNEARPTLTSIIFNLLNFSFTAEKVIENFDPVHLVLGERMKFDLGCHVSEYANGLEVTCLYRSDLFTSSTIEYLMDSYQNLLEQMVLGEEKCLSEYQLLTVPRVQLKDVLLNRQEVFKKQDIDQTLVGRFAEQVVRYGTKTAVVARDGSSLTYNQLNWRANQLANWLLSISDRSDSISSSQIIPLLLGHDLQMVIGVFSVLKTGKCYLPLDPAYPEERLLQMINNSGARFILTDHLNSRLARTLVRKSATQMTILICEEVPAEISQANPDLEIEPDQLAYILYTSGSTGKPKGVMQNQRNILHFIRNYTNNLGIQPDDRLTLFSSYSFDAAVMDLYGALLNGATLYLYNIKAESGLTKLAHWLEVNQITIYHSIPTVFRYFVKSLTGDEDLSTVRMIVLGGEAVFRSDLEAYKRHFSDQTVFINGLGPTESTVTLQYFATKDTELSRDRVPVGYPIDDTEVLILNQDGEETLVYQIGELVFKSPYLALGYWLNPAETVRVFSKKDTARLYYSGDLGRYLPDGMVEFVGRKDSQIKIRGYRIEIAEIEAALMGIGGVKEGVVIAFKDDAGEEQGWENYLTAFYTVHADQQLNPQTVKNALRSKLPGYMIPQYCICLSEMPVTSTGKIDRQGFSEPTRQQEDSQPVLVPENSVASRIRELWSKVLKVQQITLNDNFFDLGGHSLKALAVLQRIHQEFGVEITLLEFLKSPTIPELAKRISGGDSADFLEIKPAVQQQYYPLSSAQKRMFILHQLEPESVLYNMPKFLEIQGDVDQQIMQTIFNQLIERHESLRTSFHFIDGQPVQQIHNDLEIKITYLNTAEAEVGGLISKLIQPFELSKAPLFRVFLVRTEMRQILVYDLPHIIFDGVSAINLVNDFILLYQGKTLIDLPIQYKDYAVWQNDYYRSEKILAQEQYWLNVYQDLPPVLDLPLDYPRPMVFDSTGGLLSVKLSAASGRALEKLARENDATLYILLLAVYHLLLTRYTAQTDTVIGIPTAGRTNPELEQIVGMFVNTLPLRNQVDYTATFREFFQQVKLNALEAYANQDYQLELLIEKLDLVRDLSRNPLFDTVMVMRNIEQIENDLPDLKITPLEIPRYGAKFDLTVNVAQMNDEIILSFYYCTKLFAPGTIQQLADHFQLLCTQVITDPEIRVKDLELVSEDEKRFLLTKWQRAVDPLSEKTIYQQFREQVQHTPEQIAVKFQSQTLTYQQLESRVNSLGQSFLTRGVQPGEVIGLLGERSLEMVIAILSVMKVGGVSLPLDPDYPRERIDYMLADANARLIEVQNGLVDEHNCPDFEPRCTPHSLAYIIYTSGSTGKPKGVLVEQRNMISLFTGCFSLFDFDETDVWTMFHSPCFDFSVWEMYGALLSGGKLVVVEKHTAQNPENFRSLCLREGVTILNQTPTAFYNLLRYELREEINELAVRYVIFGGEALKPGKLLSWQEKYPFCQLVNMYGITETTVHVTFKEITAEDIAGNISNIGQPIPGLGIYLFDQNFKLVPTGVVGEIFVVGDGVSRGYLTQDQLTQTRFISNPYNPAERLYRSGDLARLLPDGSLEYRGRGDRQIKIRGFRIEPGEIERVLLTHQSVADLVLHLLVDNGEHNLCAYIVPTDSDLTRTELRAYLKTSLPDYMIPAYFIFLAELPLTTNGKVDLAALPEPKDELLRTGDYQPPTNQIERRLTAIWEELLQVSGVGIGDNFFELGGHSLKATACISQIHREWGIELPLRILFECPTIEELAACIRMNEEKYYLPLESDLISRDFGLPPDHYPVSSAQKQLYLINQLLGDNTVYNMPFVLQVNQQLDLERLTEVLQSLLDRHEALRTAFVWMNGQPVQKIYPELQLKINYSREMVVDRRSVSDVLDRFIRPFRLDQPPLFRVQLVELADQQFLIFDLHHIICDGVSMQVLLEDFWAVYQGSEPEKARYQFKDFACYQRYLLTSGQMKDAEIYWLNQFIGKTFRVDLPTDYPRPEVANYHGQLYKFWVGSELTENLRKAAHTEGLTLFMLILAAYQLLLGRYCQTEDVITGTPFAGRTHPDLSRVVGLFVNTLPIRNQPVGDKTIAEFLREVKESVLNASEYQEYPFELLVDRMQLKWDMSQNPIFDTVLVMEEQNGVPDFNETGLINYDYDNLIAKFELTLRGFIRGDRLKFHLEYRSKLFEKTTISLLSEDLLTIFGVIVQNRECKIQDIQLRGGLQNLDTVDFADLEFEF